MFYFGKHIATISNEETKIFIESAGEMRAAFKIDGDSYQGEILAKELKSRGTTDRGLSSIGNNDLIQMNNWFRIMDENETMEQIAHTYDDAIRLAKSLLD